MECKPYFTESEIDMWIYDIETMKNIFNMWMVNPAKKTSFYFEISERTNDIISLQNFFNDLAKNNVEMVGFNNLGFDYPVIHMMLEIDDMAILGDWQELVIMIYNKCQEIIDTPFNKRWSTRIKDPLIMQHDLFLMNHFDNPAKSTSLKVIEINIRMENVQDLPHSPHIPLSTDNMTELADYCMNDVETTTRFAENCYDMIEMRRELSEEYPYHFGNMSNSKLGSVIFEHILQEEGIELWEWKGKRKVRRQTPRSEIHLQECVLPYINENVNHGEFKTILDHINSTTITSTKGVFDGVTAEIDGLKYVFGLGGLHASRVNKIYTEDDNFEIVDVDVTAMYPSIAISNNLYPAHLGIQFPRCYERLLAKRGNYPKGTPLNLGLKEAANSVYGNSNNVYSCFYDPKYTMTTTISGQMSLCILIQSLVDKENITMIQANTDGITFRSPRGARKAIGEIVSEWERLTKLNMEWAFYSKMVIRDVNNYIAVYGG